MRWVDLSMYGLAMQLQGQVDRNLVLLALPGAADPDAADAARMGFKHRDGMYTREGQKIHLSEIRAVFPKAQVRDIDAASIHYTPPAPEPEQAGLPMPGPEVMLPAHWMPQAEFVRRAHVYQGQGGWHVDLLNVPMEVPDDVRVLGGRTSPDKIAALVHAHVVQKADNADPTQSRIEVLADYPKCLTGTWYANRQAETNVTKLLSRLAVLPRMMDYVRLGDGRTAHCRLKKPPYQDLAIEVHPSDDRFEQRVYLTHYRDDGQADGEMVYGTAKGRLWFIETAVNGPWGERRAPDRSFAGMFARNLLAQGFDTAAIDWSGELAEREEDVPAPSLRPSLG